MTTKLISINTESYEKIICTQGGNTFNYNEENCNKCDDSDEFEKVCPDCMKEFKV